MTLACVPRPIKGMEDGWGSGEKVNKWEWGWRKGDRGTGTELFEHY